MPKLSEASINRRSTRLSDGEVQGFDERGGKSADLRGKRLGHHRVDRLALGSECIELVPVQGEHLDGIQRDRSGTAGAGRYHRELTEELAGSNDAHRRHVAEWRRDPHRDVPFDEDVHRVAGITLVEEDDPLREPTSAREREELSTGRTPAAQRGSEIPWSTVYAAGTVSSHPVSMVGQTGSVDRGPVNATVLFTDIEGSTHLWEVHPDAMQIALARHDALVRAAIETNRGHVYKMVGDSFHAVFASAIDAMQAAIAAQRALGSEPWPGGAPIRERMALRATSPNETATTSARC